MSVLSLTEVSECLLCHICLLYSLLFFTVISLHLLVCFVQIINFAFRLLFYMIYYSDLWGMTTFLVTKGSEGLGGLGVSNLGGGSLGLLGKSRLLGVVGGGLDLSLLLEVGDNVLVLPAKLVRHSSDSAVLSAGLESQNSKGLGNDHSLLLVVRRGNTLEDLKSLQSSLASGSLVGDHTSNGLVEDSRGGSEMEGTVGSVESSSLSQVSGVLKLGSEKLLRDVQGLTSHNDNVLAVEDLLGNGGCQSTEKVSLS